MSLDFGFWKALVLFILFFSVVKPSGYSFAQQSEHHNTVLSAREAVDVLKPMRLGHGNSATCLFAARNNLTPLIAQSDRENMIAIAQTAREAAIEALTVLGWRSDAAVVPVGSRRVGDLLQNSFRISIGTIPVRDAGLSVTIGAMSGQLMAVSSTIGAMPTNAATPAVASETVANNLSQYLGDDKNTPVTSASQPGLVYVCSPRYGCLRLAYEMTIRQASGPHEWRITIDAVTGKLIEKKEMLEFIGHDQPASSTSGTILATVHPGSPFDSLITVGLPSSWIAIEGKLATTDSLGNWTYDNSGVSSAPFNTSFSGPFAHVVRNDTTNDTLHGLLGQSNIVVWNDQNSSSAERDAFYHVSLARNYCMKLDTSLHKLNDPVTINVNLPFSCNAFYDADSNTLNFFRSGNECNNSAEITDVVFHEFGHDVARARYSDGPNGHLTNAAMSEGFADLVSAFMRDDPRIGIGFFQNNKDKILRTCDNTKSFPADINPDPHVTGEIISGAFWDLRKMIGHDMAERLFHKMEWLNPDAPDIESADVLDGGLLITLLDLLLADDDDNNLTNGTPHSTAILRAFAKHGISLASQIQIDASSLVDQDTSANGYSVIFNADYDGLIGKIDKASMFLFYSIDKGRNYTKIQVQQIDSTTFKAVIPKVPTGSIVSYYISASLDIDSTGSLLSPSPLSPYTFVVGFKQVYFDDCENDRGWSLSAPMDNAKSGLWVRDMPHGTYNTANDSIPNFIQQDTDHTQKGTMCYITGNLNSRDIEADDVDSGATTLTTNTISLTEATSPLIRYWYYYSNDQGNNPGIPVWETQISNDDGVTWKDIQRTNLSSNGGSLKGPQWSAILFRVSDYVTPTPEMKLRFIASDNVGAVVEAGVDDIEVLSAPAEAAVERTPDVANFGINSIFPNPASQDAAAITISFSLTESAFATLVVKNVFGDVVARLLDQKTEAGSFQTRFSPSELHLPSGIYWAELSTPNARSIRKIALP